MLLLLLDTPSLLLLHWILGLGAAEGGHLV
jgi:hypothetical protein